MKIEPQGAGSTSANAARALDKKPATQPAQSEANPQRSTSAPTDRAVISDAARDLGERTKSTESAAAARLPADTLRTIVQRVCSGFYDQPEVREAVLRGMAADLDNTPTE